MSEIIKESGIIAFVGCSLMLSIGIVQVFWTLTRRIAEEDGYRAAYFDYSRAAEPPVRCGESHLSGLTEPPSLSIF